MSKAMLGWMNPTPWLRISSEPLVFLSQDMVL